jgi:hypothetical protein
MVNFFLRSRNRGFWTYWGGSAGSGLPRRDPATGEGLTPAVKRPPRGGRPACLGLRQAIIPRRPITFRFDRAGRSNYEM